MRPSDTWRKAGQASDSAHAPAPLGMRQGEILSRLCRAGGIPPHRLSTDQCQDNRSCRTRGFGLGERKLPWHSLGEATSTAGARLTPPFHEGATARACRHAGVSRRKRHPHRRGTDPEGARIMRLSERVGTVRGDGQGGHPRGGGEDIHAGRSRRTTRLVPAPAIYIATASQSHHARCGGQPIRKPPDDTHQSSAAALLSRRVSVVNVSRWGSSHQLASWYP